jgi:hypothetical protein
VNQTHEITKASTVLRKDKNHKEYLYVFAAALVPGKMDLQDQWITKEEIRETLDDFMERYQDIGYRHQALLAKSSAVLVDNFQSDREMTFDLVSKSVTYPAGTWFQGIKVFSKELIQKILSGEITGLSIGGRADKIIQRLPPK